MASSTADDFEAIYHDLGALRDNQFHVIERLSAELNGHIQEFRNLLQHKNKNNESRAKLNAVPEAGKGIQLDLGDTIYEINEDFKNQTIQLAEELDLDEIECAKLLLSAQKDAAEFDRSPIVSAIMRFQRNRQFLLECFRIAFQIAISEDSTPNSDQTDESDAVENENTGPPIRAIMDQFITDVFAPNRDVMWEKLRKGLESIEASLQRLNDRIQRAAMIGQNLSRDEAQIMEYERGTLHVQHESLAAIIAYGLKSSRISPDNFRQTLIRVKTLDKHDIVMIHYLLMVLTFCAAYGPPSNSCTDEQAAQLHNLLVDSADTDKWAMRNFCRVVRCSWIAHYKERLPDPADNTDPTTTKESIALAESLKEGGLQFMLSVAQDVKKSEWADPARVQLTNFLIKDVPVTSLDSPLPTHYFQELLMDSLQSFTHAFISNMPDTLRLLKVEEDEQRKTLRSRFQNNTQEYKYDLDRFLVLIAYAFQDDPENAKSFWSDTDGNLYGFLQWSAKRQTTPRVAAFCEMLRSISEGQVCAEYAHQFLLDEGTPVAGKLRRSASLSWTQIFAELEYFATQAKERQNATATVIIDNQHAHDQAVEPESLIMIECYLRLVSHLCQGSSSVRQFLINNDTQPLPHILFQLVTTSTDTRIRAWCFRTLATLLTAKPLEVADAMWEKLDAWIAGNALQPNSRAPLPPGGPVRSEQFVFEMISAGFDEAEGFMRLLNHLIVPSQSETGLNDMVPFPENLGTPYRLPGIDNYVDFALGKVFGEQTNRLTDKNQLNLLRLSCLDFIRTGLISFNENLVIIANRSTMPLDYSMRTSSLEAYVCLHPFSRIMEWLSEDKCLDALFATAIQDAEIVNQVTPDSPLLISIVRAIEVMNSIMALQSTYSDVVRPYLKKKLPNRKPVTRSPVPFFEDAVLKRLDIIVHLGLYCGLGYSELTLQSLKLLESLSSSKKLSIPRTSIRENRMDRSKLITALEKEGEAERVSRAMTSAMGFDEREFESGPLASGYNIKAGILSFLVNTLSASPDRPNLAHLMLGFGCKSQQIIIQDQDAFIDGSCLFYAIARLAIAYPDFVGNTYLSWASAIKQTCIEVLRTLWRSSLSGDIVSAQLRESDFVFVQATQLQMVNSQTLWDELPCVNEDFMINDSALAFKSFLLQRTAFFDLFARELRVAQVGKITSYLQRLQSTLLGSTSFPSQRPLTNASIFDLFDFMELEVAPPRPLFNGRWLKDSLFAICRSDDPDASTLYDLQRAEEVIMLQRNEFFKNRPGDPSIKDVARLEDQEMQSFEQEASDTLISIVGQNNWKDVSIAHARTLVAWVRLTIVAVEACDFETGIRVAFIQQAYQLITPKFEKAVQGDLPTAMELAGLILTLLNASAIDASSQLPGASFNGATSTNLAASGRLQVEGVGDVECQAFRAALYAAASTSTTLDLREICYQICCQYLRKSIPDNAKGSLKRRNILRAIKSVHERLVEVVCDDAYSSRNSCGIAALLLLEALVTISGTDDSKLLLESLERLNFVPILVDSIKQIPKDLGQASTSEIPLVIGYHNAGLALLLRIAQSRVGAVQVLNAGLFQGVRDSEIFSADPDVGIEMDNDEALKNFFDLMLAVLRIINAIVLRHQSDQTIAPARDFLLDNRQSIVGIFKRYAKVGGVEINGGIDLSDLVDNLTLLISATDFLGYEESTTVRKKTMLDVFS